MLTLTTWGGGHAIERVRTAIYHVSPERTEVEVTWEGRMAGCRRVRQRYTLSAEHLDIECELAFDRPRRYAFLAPLLHSNGAELSAIESVPAGFSLRRDGWTYAVACETPAQTDSRFVVSPLRWLRARGANRNGIYFLGRIEAGEPSANPVMRLRLRLRMHTD